MNTWIDDDTIIHAEIWTEDDMTNAVDEFNEDYNEQIELTPEENVKALTELSEWLMSYMPSINERVSEIVRNVVNDRKILTN